MTVHPHLLPPTIILSCGGSLGWTKLNNLDLIWGAILEVVGGSMRSLGVLGRYWGSLLELRTNKAMGLLEVDKVNDVMYAVMRDITPLWYHARKGTCISCLSFKDAFIHSYTHTHTHTLPPLPPSPTSTAGGVLAG